MNTRNKINATTLAAALLFAPLTPAVTSIAQARSAMAAHQDSDVPSDAEQAMFTRGQNLYNQGRYEQAAGVLRDFLKNYPNSIITDLTLLWLGRSYMQLGRIPDAEQVGLRLREIRDTPFSDIYEGELQAARRDAASRPATTTTTASSAPDNRVTTPTKPAATTTTTPAATRQPPTASASPTPSPSRPAQTNNTAASTNRNTTPASVNMNTSSAAQRGNTNKNGPQARLITSNTPPQQPVASAVTTPTPDTPRQNNRGRERRTTRRQQPPSSQTQANTNQPAATTTASTNTSNRAPSNQVAVNNPPSTTPPVNSSGTTPNSSVSSSTTTETPAVTTPTTTPASAPPQTGGLNITVKQVPNLALALTRASESASPGQTVRLPLTVTNSGNKEDQFRLETDLPAEYQPTFNLAGGANSETGLPILVTPQLARGASVDVVLNLRVPETATDGQQRRFFVRAASQADYQIMRIADGSINVVAPALAATSNVSQASVMPGDTFNQTIVIRNSGSTSARSSRADFVFNPNFELVSASPSPVAYDQTSRTAIWSLGDLGGRDTREINVKLRAIPDALAATNPLGRGTLRTQSLPFGSNFDSPNITVGKIPRARIDAVSPGLTVTPGDTTFVPFVVRNPGNGQDAYELRITAPGAPAATIFADTNGDGQHQENEVAVTQTAPIDPQGGQFPMLMRVSIPSSTPDRQQYSYNVVARSLTSNRVASEASTVLTVATPKVRVRTEQVTDASAPGDTIFYRLVLVNDSSGLAKNLVVNETLPDALELVSSDPALNSQDAPGGTQRFTWRVAELAPGDTAVLRIAVRLRPNLQAETNLTSRHTLTYQDSNGNNYQGQ
ncbi:MAG: tetratricopeptide repeat protein [Pyrinomonadaceae bacterium]